MVLPNDKPQITITVEEYEELLDDQKVLDALRAAGVDNWDGWDYAMDIYHGDDGAEGE